MHLIVVPETPSHGPARRGRLIADGIEAPCALGRAGISTDKREGDGATPAGRFPLRCVLYRADRLDAPATGLPLRPIGRDDGWCDDPGHADYNRPVSLPFAGSAEELWRGDHRYDLVVIIGYNDAPPVAGKGSAVFLHVATDDLAPTAGCVAVAREDLAAIADRLAPGDDIDIRAKADR